jgi:hypothetical protein
VRQRFVWFTVAMFGLGAVVVLLVLATFLPLTTGYVPRGVARHVRQIFPEGWPLFTRDPPAFEPRVAILRSGRWVWADRGPLGSPGNAFGLHKVAIAQNVEVAMIAARLPARDTWPGCRGSALACLKELDDAGRRIPRVLNARRASPTYCGRIGVVYLGPEPWSRKREQPATRFLIADVACRPEG